jgi:hypothetical protein
VDGDTLPEVLGLEPVDSDVADETPRLAAWDVELRVLAYGLSDLS